MVTKSFKSANKKLFNKYLVSFFKEIRGNKVAGLKACLTGEYSAQVKTLNKTAPYLVKTVFQWYYDL